MARGQATDQARLKIGAVARHTGLSAHNLRKWEERYQAVKPHRSPSGERLYTQEDVRRLILIKRLSGAGVPIGEVAGASLAELERLSEQTVAGPVPSGAAAETPKSIRVVVVGSALRSLGAPDGSGQPEIDVILRSPDLETAAQELSGRAVDVVALDCPTVHDGTQETVTDARQLLKAKGAVVIYGFGARAALTSLRRAGVVTVRSPIDADEFRRAARDVMQKISAASDGRTMAAAEQEAEAAPPRFSQQAVARIVEMSPSIKCECPNHLAQIVMNLRAFEQYSRECESTSPEDVELHHYLALVAGRSRAAFEEALARVAEAEGISIRD